MLIAKSNALFIRMVKEIVVLKDRKMKPLLTTNPVLITQTNNETGAKYKRDISWSK